MSEREHEELMWVLNRIADELANIAAGLSGPEPEPDCERGTDNPMSFLMNTDAAAKFLDRPASTLSLWRHKGIGPPHVKVGGRVFYRRDDLLGWLQAQMDGRA